MIFKIKGSVTIEAETPREAESIMESWINGLEDLEVLMEGTEDLTLEFVEPDFDEPDPQPYDYSGPSNYPGRPL